MDKRAGMGVAMADCMGAVQGQCDRRPTAPQNLELGQVDLIKTEDLSDRWPQGGGSLNPGLEANQGQVEARIVERRRPQSSH